MVKGIPSKLARIGRGDPDEPFEFLGRGRHAEHERVLLRHLPRTVHPADREGTYGSVHLAVAR